MKKAIRKKVNPEKSNKMIYAVAVGLTVIIVLLAVIFVDISPRDREEIIKEYTESLKKFRGIMETKIDIDDSGVELLYDSFSNPDFTKNVFFVLQSMSREFKELGIKIRIYKNAWENLELKYLLQNGKVIRK